MSDSYKKLIALLKEKNLPPFPSLLPRELRTHDIDVLLKKSIINLLNELEDNKDLSFLLTDYINVPLECNLEEIEEILRKEPLCSFEEKEIEKENKINEFVSANNFTNRAPKEQKKEIKEEENEIVDNYLLERIKSEIIDSKQNIKWSDVVGLELVKKNINEIVLWPMQRPDLFKGLRGPPKGLLFFGPPGTGKTMIGKCIANEVKATFFSISSSSLTSKWVGEGEKMVRALFFLARKMQPSVIFVDEIDSLLCQRQENENEGTRRIKTEFLVQFDGIGTDSEDKILLIGATNRPQEIDEAARRRLVKRIYVPLPEKEARILMITNLLKDLKSDICEKELDVIAEKTEGYSGSDIFNLCREASLEPLREISDIRNVSHENTRPVSLNDFLKATKQIRKSVSQNDLEIYLRWNEVYGSTN
ncbi:fidgetin 1 [Tubulinosema ratisbonensis]|uniref:Fidgetin 1 n=1 Tax=Tubulinosema ratisbonensis TaxID=291195 RepID=A0A437ANB2_9MICR|nr:fidgetin 1 [Tubulinosema ratisbonensis]